MKNNIIFTIFFFLLSLSFYAQDTGFGDLSTIETPPSDASSSFGAESQVTEEVARPLFWVYYPHAREILKKGKAKSISFKDGRAIVTMPKAGAMIDIAVGGQKFEYQDWSK